MTEQTENKDKPIRRRQLHAEQERRLDEKGWLSLREASARTSVSTQFFRNYIAKGVLDVMHIGERKQYIHKDQIRELIGPVLSLWLDSDDGANEAFEAEKRTGRRGNGRSKVLPKPNMTKVKQERARARQEQLKTKPKS